MKDLISIIVPVYNTEKYLKRCLDSLLGQSYKNLEIIVVNDGSTDNSAQILEEYEKKDERVRVFNKPNGGGGATSAVHYGIKKAAGEYIAFVDSDDYVDKDFILTFTTNIEDADVLATGIYYQYPETAVEFNLLQDKIYSGSELKALQNDFIYDNSFGISKKIFVSRWNKLYRTTIVKKINDLYAELNLIHCEDSYFVFLVINESSKIKTIKQVGGYHYCINSVSVTHMQRNEEGFLNYLAKIARASQIVSEKLNTPCYIQNALIVFEGWDYLCYYALHLPKKQAKQEMKKVLCNEIYKKALKTFRYSRMDFRGKIKLFLFRWKQSGLLRYIIRRKQI